jgi:uncharacterized protein YwqG
MNRSVVIKKIVPHTEADMRKTTFFGGRPLASAKFDWPVRKPTSSEVESGITNPRPMHFVCQIDFTEITRHPSIQILPETGTLYLFYALDLDDFLVESGEEPFWRFVYQPIKSASLRKITPPGELGFITMGGQQPGDAIVRGSVQQQSREFSYVPVELETEMLHFSHEGPPESSIAEIKTDLDHFPESVRHARCWLEHDIDNVKARLNVLSENLRCFDLGVREAHPRVAFFHELKKEMSKTGLVTDQEVWTRLRNDWEMTHNVFAQRRPILEGLRATLDDFHDRDQVKQELRKEFQEQLSLSIRHSVFGSSWSEETYKAARQYLLSRFPLDELPFSDAEAKKATLERARGESNRDQLLGIADEVQAASRQEALEYAQSMGWASRNHKESDLCLLLQVDSCEAGSGMQWADAGKAYFYILREDLKERRFDRVAHVLHGH